jgi:hypothetical protein
VVSLLIGPGTILCTVKVRKKLCFGISSGGGGGAVSPRPWLVVSTIKLVVPTKETGIPGWSDIPGVPSVRIESLDS